MLMGLYFIVLYLELSIATFIELCFQFIWPTSHILLRFGERFLKITGSFLGQLDDLNQGMFCDLANTWCSRFNLMCKEKCSFVGMVVDRMRP